MTCYDDLFVTERYAREVVDGLRLVCKRERQACQRHLDDLERQGTDSFPYVFDESRANRIFDWFEKYCVHVRGVYSGQHIQLLPFQYFDLGCVFGWVHRETGARRFTKAFNFRARGNVKSTEMSGVAFYTACVLTLSIRRVSLSCGALKWHRRLNARPWTGNRQDVFGVMPVLWVKLL